MCWSSFIIEGKSAAVYEWFCLCLRELTCANFLVFKKRFVDYHKQDWHCHVTESNVHENFKSALHVEPYLYYLYYVSKALRNALISMGISFI